jgi:hypothetical protein
LTDGIVFCCHFAGVGRTQIKLPDDTFDRAKKLCEARAITMA